MCRDRREPENAESTQHAAQTPGLIIKIAKMLQKPFLLYNRASPGLSAAVRSSRALVWTTAVAILAQDSLTYRDKNWTQGVTQNCREVGLFRRHGRRKVFLSFQRPVAWAEWAPAPPELSVENKKVLFSLSSTASILADVHKRIEFYQGKL